MDSEGYLFSPAYFSFRRLIDNVTVVLVKILCIATKLLHFNWMPLGFRGGSDDNLPAVQETWVWSLNGENALEKEMATHFSILAGRVPWKKELGGLQSMESQRVRQDWGRNTFTFTLGVFLSFCKLKWLYRGLVKQVWDAMLLWFGMFF